MRILVILAVALCATAAVAADLPTGKMGENHSMLHSGFYKDLFNKKKAMSCCHDKDCRPTQSRMIGDHYEVMINGTWMQVDDKSILPESAPDGGAHVCAGDPTSMDPLGRVYCVILPPEA